MIYLKPSCDVPLHHDVPDGLLSLQLNVVFQEPGRDHYEEDYHGEAGVDVDDHDHDDHDDPVDEIIHLLSILSWQSFLSSAKLSFMF